MSDTATDMHILAGRLRVAVPASIPADRLRPILVDADGRGIFLAHGRPRILSLPFAPRQQVEFACDLTAHGGHARQLQLWADGFLLHQIVASAASCGIADIVDYAVTGWITNAAAGTAMLYLDGVPIRAITAAAPDPTTPDGCLRVAEPLPAAALDGRRHLIEVVVPGAARAALLWRSRLRVDLTMGREALGVRVADAALSGGRITFSAQDSDTGARIFHTTLDPSGDELRFAVPAHAATVVISIGGAAQHELARLLPLAHLHTITRTRALARLQLLSDPGNALARSQDRALLNRPPPDDAATHRLHRGGGGRGVTLIVPICTGILETRACLASLHAACTAGDAIDAIILVDDAACDPAMAIVLAGHAARHDTTPVTLLRHTNRGGFVAAVTTGIAAADVSHDIILLNADTVVPPRLAARLRAAAYARPDIASATPLSNNAAIASLPDPQAPNDLTAAEVMTLDSRLEVTRAAGVDLPTGSGFCLYLRRDALDDVGGFDPAWGRGHCEEVDWCLRARDRGWSHVAAVDVAVFHHRSVSFGQAERATILACNHPALEARYPEYTTEIRMFLARDPLADLRADAFCRLLTDASTHVLLHFTHAMGGATTILVKALAARFAADPGRANLICSRLRDDVSGADIFRIEWAERGLTLRLAHHAIEALVARLADSDIILRLLLHSLTGVGPAIRAIVASDIPYAVHVHDYQWSCPRVVLVDHTGLHCNEPGLRHCQLCVRAGPTDDFGSENDAIRHDLAGWISANARLLDDAVAVIVPSQDSFARLRRQFPKARLRLVPHPDHTQTACITRAGDAQQITRIAVVGGLSVQNGRDVLLRLASAIDAAHAPILIEVFGQVEHEAAFQAFGCLRLHGPHSRADLPDLLAEAHPHFVLFPSVWPDTWCFALSDVWTTGYPAVAFDIGAIAERIRNTRAGTLLAYPPEADLITPLLNARATVAAQHDHRFQIAPVSPDDPVADLFDTSIKRRTTSHAVKTDRAG